MKRSLHLQRHFALNRIPSLPLLLTMTLMMSAGRADAFEFTAEGVVTIRENYPGYPPGETNYNFKAEVRDCSFRIRVFGGTFSASEYEEFGCDSTNSYRLDKFWANQETRTVFQVSGDEVKSVTLDKPIKSENEATMTIRLGDMPDRGFGFEPVWLAYASGCHYKARTSGDKSDPVWRMGDKSDALFKSTWQLNRVTPNLLERMVDFTDGKKYERYHRPLVAADLSKSGGDTNWSFKRVGELTVTPMPRPFDVETTNSVYQVLIWTNVGRMMLPQRFQIVLYSPDLSATSSPSLKVSRVYEGTAVSLHPTCETTDFSPRVPGSIRTRVVDHRLR